MPNSEAHSKYSKFMISLSPSGLPYLAQHETCFGRARDPNHSTLETLGGMKSVSGDYLGVPKNSVRIMGCGMLHA